MNVYLQRRGAAVLDTLTRPQAETAAELDALMVAQGGISYLRVQGAHSCLLRSPHVISYAKNDHLDFVIPYELYGARLNYIPDYLIRLRRGEGSELNLILEVKGFETEADRQKQTTAERGSAPSIIMGVLACGIW